MAARKTINSLFGAKTPIVPPTPVSTPEPIVTRPLAQHIAPNLNPTPIGSPVSYRLPTVAQIGSPDVRTRAKSVTSPAISPILPEKVPDFDLQSAVIAIPQFYEQMGFDKMAPHWVTLLYSVCDIMADDIARYYIAVKKQAEAKHPPGTLVAQFFDSCRYDDLSRVEAVEATLIRIKRQREVFRRVLIEACDQYNRIDRELANRVFDETVSHRLWPGLLSTDVFAKR